MYRPITQDYSGGDRFLLLSLLPFKMGILNQNLCKLQTFLTLFNDICRTTLCQIKYFDFQ